MRKLYLGNGNKQFKFADTTTEIHLSALDNGSAATLSADAKVRIKNDSGYLLDVNAGIDNNHAVITSGQLAKLPTGGYLIELWDTVDGGTAIYPSDGFLTLQINENVTGISGGLVSSITVDDFVQQFSSLSEQLKQQVSDAVANGLKGDTGADGLSAYQVAVINGYQGSQTEWLTSLIGETGKKGEKGDPGKDFRIVKTFPSIAEMNGTGFSDGDFTMIASDVNDPDDGKLYVWNGTGFTYIADLSGSQGIKGDTGKTGDTGEKGDPGDQGLSAYQVAVNAGFSGSVDQWLASLVGPQGAMTTQDIQSVVTNMLSYKVLASRSDLFTLINNTGYTKHYCITTNAGASSLLNCPVKTPFALDIKTSSLANQPIGTTGNATYVYNVLELHPINSNSIWTAAISTDGQGNIIATPWKSLTAN